MSVFCLSWHGQADQHLGPTEEQGCPLVVMGENNNIDNTGQELSQLFFGGFLFTFCLRKSIHVMQCSKPKYSYFIDELIAKKI